LDKINLQYEEFLKISGGAGLSARILCEKLASGAATSLADNFYTGRQGIPAAP